VTVYHKESQTTGQQSPLRTYYIVRNRLLLVKRNWNGGTKYLTYMYLIGAVGVRDLVKYAISGKWDLLKATINGLRDFYNNQFSARLCRLYER
jgi:GT2 family glycosyltransferase